MNFQLQRYPSNEKPKPILVPRKEVAWEGGAVFNPSVVFDNGIFRMLYRTYPNNLEKTTPRLKRPGFHLKNQTSYIGYAESKDGINFEKRDNPFISPDTDYDRYGCEDPRITKIGDTFYITYTAIDGPLEDRKNRPSVRIALATTKDFITLEKHGIIGPRVESKAAAFFPEMIDGKIVLLLTVQSDSINSSIYIRYFDSIDDIFHTSFEGWDNFLQNSKPILGTNIYLHRGPELGAAPIKTKDGWLLIFSSESMSDSWTISAALLDIDNPNKLIARTSGNILQPATKYETEGIVPNVTFPEGAVIISDTLYVYYGCADTVIGLATCKLDDLLNTMIPFGSDM